MGLPLDMIGRSNKEQFATGVWGNAYNVPVLNSKRKFSVSEFSFNFDDTRFNSVSPKASRFQTDYKTLTKLRMKTNEEKKAYYKICLTWQLT